MNSECEPEKIRRRLPHSSTLHGGPSFINAYELQSVSRIVAGMADVILRG